MSSDLLSGVLVGYGAMQIASSIMDTGSSRLDLSDIPFGGSDHNDAEQSKPIYISNDAQIHPIISDDNVEWNFAVSKIEYKNTPKYGTVFSVSLNNFRPTLTTEWFLFDRKAFDLNNKRINIDVTRCFKNKDFFQNVHSALWGQEKRIRQEYAACYRLKKVRKEIKETVNETCRFFPCKLEQTRYEEVEEKQYCKLNSFKVSCMQNIFFYFDSETIFVNVKSLNNPSLRIYRMDDFLYYHKPSDKVRMICEYVPRYFLDEKDNLDIVGEFRVVEIQTNSE